MHGKKKVFTKRPSEGALASLRLNSKLPLVSVLCFCFDDGSSLHPRPSQVLYHPISRRSRDLGQPGHPDYHPVGANRAVLIRTAPPGTATPPDMAARLEATASRNVTGAAFFGTFTMGAGTTSSHPDYDRWSSSWHGFLEPLVDVVKRDQLKTNSRAIVTGCGSKPWRSFRSFDPGSPPLSRETGERAYKPTF